MKVNPVAGKTRVLMVLEEWSRGGTEAYVEGLGGYLSRIGRFEVALALIEGPEASDAIRGWPGEVVALGGGLPSALVSLQRLIRDWGPQVCHLHLYTSLLPVALLVRCLHVPRVVTTLHMPLRQWSWRHRVMWRAAVGLSHRVVGVSRDVVQSLGRSPQPPCTYVIPAALPRPASAGTRDRAADRRPSFVVCGAGRLACEKDWPTLLRAFAALRTAIGQPVKLVLFGDGPLREELQRLAATLAIGDTLELRGWTSRDAFLSELRRMDLFVLPSRFEGLGMAAVEAMQEGVPTITADFGASYDFIEDGVTGHRFPQGDWAALADLMRWHHDHRSAAACIGWRGRQFVLERYSEENTFGLYPSIYRDGLSP